MRVIFEVHWTREHEGKPENQTNVELVKTNKKSRLYNYLVKTN